MAPRARIRGCWNDENGPGFTIRQLYTLIPGDINDIRIHT